jgi:hypothetical protein
MKRRGWRVALTVATLGLALVAGLVAFNWATVRDHAEAWWFVATRETREVNPSARFRRLEGTWQRPYSLEKNEETPPLTDWGWRFLASDSDRPVVFSDVKDPWWSFEFSWDPPTVEETLILLRKKGYRIIDQRFPHLVYVVTGYPQR